MPEPDDLPTIDVDDPLLPHFVLQFNVRERYLHVLEEIVKVAEAGSELDVAPKDIERALRDVYRLAADAIDPDKTKVWLQEGAPMPWLDTVVGDEAARIEREVRDMLEGR